MSDPAHLDLEALMQSWVLGMRAERKSPATIKAYTDAVTGFIRWCGAEDVPVVLDRPTVNAYVAGLLDAGREPTTARARQLGIRRFSAWLTAEGEVDADPLLGIKVPKLDRKVIEPLTETEIKALLKACAGNYFRARRDEALVRLMVETGMRAGEAAGLSVEDVNLLEGVAIVRRGKGGKCQAPGFVEAPFLGFLRSHSISHGLVDPFRMDLEWRSIPDH